MTPLEIFIPGRPMGKGRPRFTRAGGVYTDAKTKAKEREVSMLAKVGMVGRHPFTGPVRVKIDTWAIGNRTDKPDCDNTAKLILDAFNGIVWTDDKNVVALTIEKHSTKTDPQTIVHVEGA